MKIINLPIRVLTINRELFHNMKNGIVLLAFCVICLQAMSQNTQSKIYKLNKKNKIERLLSYSTLDINGLSNAADLRLLGKVFLNNHYFEKAEICYQQLVTKFNTLALDEDYMNYYFCLLNLRKHDVILKSNNAKFDSSQWVRLLRLSASVSNYFHNKEAFESSALNSNISIYNGFSITNDTIHYFADRQAGGSILAETDEILSNRLGKTEVKYALLLNDSITDIPDFEQAFKIKSLKYIGRQVYELPYTNDIFYSVEHSKSGRQSILIESDWIIPFPFNSDEYDCSMPFFDEKSQTLYFCSNKPGGYGNLDIYYSKLKDGKWLQPVNLGDKINTPFTEIYPAVSSYGLLFSSNGRIGMGGFDNYIFSYENQTCYNLYQYNSIGNDYGLQEIGNTTIGFKNEKLVNYNSLLSRAYLMAKTEENDLNNFLYSQKVEGLKKIILAKEDSVNKVNDDLKIEAQKAENNEIVNSILNTNIYFDWSQSIIKESQLSTIDSIFSSLLNLHINQVYVLGFTDVSGSVAYNNILAYQRSVSVINYLKVKGVTPDMVKFIPVAIGENLSKTNKINSEERKVHLLLAEQISNEFGIVAVKLPNSENVSNLSSSYTESSYLPNSKNLKYFSVRTLHLVLPGETLHKLSLLYNCTVEKIKQLNNRNSNVIVEGEYLFIPYNAEMNHTIK